MSYDLPGLPWLIDLRTRLRRNGDLPVRPVDAIRYLVVHHSAAPRDDTAETINNFHIDGRGWEGIGYHLLVHWDGRAEYVADMTEMRAGVYARNHEIVSVCLPGDWTGGPPPKPALDATQRLLAGLRQALGRPIPIVGHRDIAVAGWATACPGDSWPRWRPSVLPDETERPDKEAGTVAHPDAPPEAPPQTYTVRPGDTLFSVARQHATTVAELVRINDIADADLVFAGQRLMLRAGPRVHVVRKGDTLWSVARRYETSVDALLRLNPQVLDRNLILPGQSLHVE